MPAVSGTIRAIRRLVEEAEEREEGEEVLGGGSGGRRVSGPRSRLAALRGFSRERWEKVVDGLKHGLTLKDSCRLAKVSVYEVRVWLREALDGDASDELREFYEEFRAAPVALEYALLRFILGSAAAGSWQAAAWLLERIAPERWGGVRHRVMEEGVRPLRVILDIGKIDGGGVDERRVVVEGIARELEGVVGDGEGSAGGDG